MKKGRIRNLVLASLVLTLGLASFITFISRDNNRDNQKRTETELNNNFSGNHMKKMISQ